MSSFKLWPTDHIETNRRSSSLVTSENPFIQTSGPATYKLDGSVSLGKVFNIWRPVFSSVKGNFTVKWR